MTGYVKGVYSADIIVDDADERQRAVELLSKEFPDASVDTNEEYIFFEFVEVAKYWFTRGVMYTRNGDGWPDEYEDELSYADKEDFRDDIMNVLKDIEYDIDNITYNTEDLKYRRFE